MLSFSILFFFHNRKRTYQAVLLLTLSLTIYISTTLLVRGYSMNVGGMASILKPSNNLIIIQHDKSLSESVITEEQLLFLEQYAKNTPNIVNILPQVYIPAIVVGDNKLVKETRLRIFNFTRFNEYNTNHRFQYHYDNPSSSEVILGNYLSSLLSSDKGSTVSISLPSFNINITPVVNNIMLTNDEYTIEIMANENICNILNISYYSFVELKIKDTREIPQIKSEIAKYYPMLDISTERQTHAFITYATEDIIRTLTLLQSLFFVLMLISITYSIYSLVKESEKEIFILRSIGSTSFDIVKLFMLQSLYIGLLSAVLSLIGGYLFIYSIVGFVSAIAQLPFIALVLYPDLIGMILFFAITLSILSGIYPSIIAAKIRVTRQEELI